MRRVGIAALWLIVSAALWLIMASGVFLWLAGLWDNPLIPWWSRPWQFAIYALHGDGSLSEDIYLIIAAIIASMPASIYVRFFLFSSVGAGQSPVYGRTSWATDRQMTSGRITSTQKPF